MGWNHQLVFLLGKLMGFPTKAPRSRGPFPPGFPPGPFGGFVKCGRWANGILQAMGLKMKILGGSTKIVDIYSHIYIVGIIYIIHVCYYIAINYIYMTQVLLYESYNNYITTAYMKIESHSSYMQLIPGIWSLAKILAHMKYQVNTVIAAKVIHIQRVGN